MRPVEDTSADQRSLERTLGDTGSKLLSSLVFAVISEASWKHDSIPYCRNLGTL